MLAANAELDRRPGLAAPRAGDLDQLADAFDIDRNEGIALQDVLALVAAEETAGIVARQAERGLGQIIGAEAEEFRTLGDLAGSQRRAWQLDHGADEIIELD